MKASKLSLAPLQKRILYGTISILWLTGAIWIYILETNPLRPLWMKIHGAAAMAFLMVFGTLLMKHVPAGLDQDQQRPSGLSTLISCGILILTGWGLYYLGNETLRLWISRTHTWLGLGLPLIIFLHIRGSSIK